MVKSTNSKSKGDKEITVEKPKEEKPVISSQPLEKKPELDLTKLKDSIVSELKTTIEPKDETKPKKRR